MNTTTFKLAESHGTDLSSRDRAIVIRENLSAAIAAGCSPVVVDFESVRTVSESFADELFAVLVQDHGEGWFKSNVQIVNAARSVRLSILEAISERCAA